MHPQQSTRVPPGGTRFPPEARRVGGVAQRQLSAVQDLVAMQVRDGHLSRRNEVEFVWCRLVCVFGELGDLARALYRRALDDERLPCLRLAVLPGVEVER